MASWLGLGRVSVTLAEQGHRSLPHSAALQEARLTFASLGRVLDAAGQTQPAPPPLPPPTPDPEPLLARLDYCQHHLRNLRYKLKLMQTRAVPFEARLKALPALRAWTGPVRNPALEENWLALFEAEAQSGLLDDCGAGPQKLLEARIAGLEREAEVLGKLVEQTPPAF
ncbi:hypothetical protein [Hymenobacter persicinus]|uniref:Uncharacterized protein n=1 Tax=Hymenobacter persicinus TaxID=2025506 RepID=A0A4Q5LE62_9BACT|nr:hypothetical protein [Hymenobacter persicinus]RYU82426.1 hypothetical protein EWM57_04395 [Hymenobacter persicinus]